MNQQELTIIGAEKTTSSLVVMIHSDRRKECYGLEQKKTGCQGTLFFYTGREMDCVT